jgi:hypothetical protein
MQEEKSTKRNGSSGSENIDHGISSRLRLFAMSLPPELADCELQLRHITTAQSLPHLRAQRARTIAAPVTSTHRVSNAFMYTIHTIRAPVVCVRD